MKFQKNKINLILFLLLLLMIPLVNGANINGWGSDTFFGYDQQYTSFSVDYQQGFNETILFGSNDEPVVCNIDTSTVENELIVYSGTTVKMYSGIGNALTEIDSFTTSGNINKIACYGDSLFVANDGFSLQYFYDNGWEFGIGTPNTALDISCSYEAGECVVLIEDGFMRFLNPSSDAPNFGFISGTTYQNNSLSFVSGDDEVQFGDYGLTYVWDKVSDVVSVFNTTSNIEPNRIALISVSDVDNEKPIVSFADFGNDGVFEMCYTDLNRVGVDDFIDVRCYNADGTFLNSERIIDGVPFVGDVHQTVLNPTGLNSEICYRYDTNVVTEDYKCYEALSDSVTSYFGAMKFTGDNNIKGFFFNDGDLGTVFRGSIFKENILITDTDQDELYGVVADLNGDTKGEIIVSKLNTFTVFFDSPIDTGIVPPTITFANNVIDGGFFGYYTGDTCTGTTIEFQALECIGDLEQCNYYNSDPAESERLKTDCGLGGSDLIGSFDSVNPRVQCTFNTEGDYEVAFYIQDSSLLNTTNNENAPVKITVKDSANCNNENDFLNQPNQNPDIPTNDTGSGQPPTDVEPTDPDTPDTGYDPSILVENIFNIISIGIIIAVLVAIAIAGVKHPIVYFGAVVLTTILCTSIGILNIKIAFFIVIAFLVICLAVGLLFKNSNSGGQ